jgi:hypothetical protein
MTMVSTSIRQNIPGVIAHIDYYSGYLKIQSADGKRYSVSQNRIVNAPGGHRCLARKDDEINFLVNPDDHITEIRFLHPPEAEIAHEERSIVDAIRNNLIFAERIEPDCHCPILIGQHHKLPEIEVGMIVRHNLGTYNNKITATNVRVDWNAYGDTK